MGKPITLCYSRNNFQAVKIPQEDRFLNMQIIGPTGTGKTSQVMIPLIFQDLMDEEVGVTVFDPKEDLSKKVIELALKTRNRKVVYFDPTRSDCPKIDLFRGSSEDIIKTLSRIFVNTSSINSQEEKNAVYVARNLIDKSVHLLKEYPDLCGNQLNIDSYSDFISDKFGNTKLRIQKLKDSLKGTKEYMRISDCDWFLKNYFNPDTKTYDYCADFRSRIEELSTNYYLSEVFVANSVESKNIIDFDKHIAEGDVVIINTKNTLLGYLGRILGEILMMLYTNSVFKRFQYNKVKGIKIVKPNFLYIDEFATYSAVTVDLFTQGRAFSVGTHIAVQNRTLLEMCGGFDSSSEAFAIESNTRNLVLFPGLNGEDADYFSKQFFNLSPAEILYRPFGQIVYRIVKNKTTLPPGIGLVFFIDETPNANSIAREYKFDKDGKIIYNKFDDYINDDIYEIEHGDDDN